MGNQHCLLEVVSTEQMFQDAEEIKKSKIISALLQNVDWVTELRLSCNGVNLSSELILKKVEKCLTIIRKLFKSISKFIIISNISNIFSTTCL